MASAIALAAPDVPAEPGAGRGGWLCPVAGGWSPGPGRGGGANRS